MKTLIKLLQLVLLIIIASIAHVVGQQTTEETPRFETTYDNVKNQTMVRLLPLRISGEKDKYYSLHMSPSFSYPGLVPVAPSIIDFELQTVVKGRLSTDLYVVFIVDGETIFLSSTRWAVKRPIPGRVWMGERLVFRMPYETLLKLAEAKKVEIKMDAVRFEVGEPQLKAIRDFAAQVKAANQTK
ncbi:MAG: hypothetical protein AABN95_19185 [Acidobacteriota bacterium]